MKSKTGQQSVMGKALESLRTSCHNVKVPLQVSPISSASTAVNRTKVEAGLKRMARIISWADYFHGMDREREEEEGERTEEGRNAEEVRRAAWRIMIKTYFITRTTDMNAAITNYTGFVTCGPFFQLTRRRSKYIFSAS